MKWISIKLNMLPLIFQEIDNVTETYIKLLQSLITLEKNKKEANANADSSNMNSPYKSKPVNSLKDGNKKRLSFSHQNELEDEDKKRQFTELRESVIFKYTHITILDHPKNQ